MNYVFYKGALYDEYDPAELKGEEHHCPTFSWIYNSEQRCWYYMETLKQSTYIRTECVPADYRALLLLINPPST